MPFYTRHPLDTLLLSDPFFTSFTTPSHHNTPHNRGGDVSTQAQTTDTNIRAFSPNFDVHETPKEYVLEGELPGLDKKNLSIEFTDTNTLVVRGKIERSFQAGTPPKGAIEGASMKGAIKESGEKKESKEVNVEKNKRKSEEEEEAVKYWVSERTVGSFQRSFSFPGEINQDGVKASLDNGIVKITVPKKEKRGTKRVEVQ
ncbi:small heat shock protein [Peziza echinospora]|nr:small heat shock protein [Peziza echinospora]